MFGYQNRVSLSCHSDRSGHPPPRNDFQNSFLFHIYYFHQKYQFNSYSNRECYIEYGWKRAFIYTIAFINVRRGKWYVWLNVEWMISLMDNIFWILTILGHCISFGFHWVEWVWTVRYFLKWFSFDLSIFHFYKWGRQGFSIERKRTWVGRGWGGGVGSVLK